MDIEERVMEFLVWVNGSMISFEGMTSSILGITSVLVLAALFSLRYENA